jgi:PIN domain nuclease of toxin-antitoxin system
MNHLIDTHTLLWYLNADKKLSKNALHTIEDPNNRIFISQATLFEMAIKVSLGKLKLPCEWDELFFQFNKIGWSILPFRNVDFARLSKLPFHHGDPFDRLIACQCLNQKLDIISKDPIFEKHKIKRIWN